MDSNWLINWQQGTCSHKNGLFALIDLNTTASGAIRCVGPWDTKPSSEPNKKLATTELTRLIETMFPESYVVFGEYDPSPLYEEHKIVVNGCSGGFIPFLSVRSLLVQEDRSDWVSQGSYRYHKSGLLHTRGEPLYDLQVLHPNTILFDTQTLSQLVYGPSVHSLHSPTLDWTPIEAAFLLTPKPPTHSQQTNP